MNKISHDGRIDRQDYSDTASFIIPTKDGYRCYPMNIEAVEAYEEWKKDSQVKKNNRSQAV